MGNWTDQQEGKKEIRERYRVRKETLAKYFFDLSKLTFTAMVLGGIVTLYADSTKLDSWYLMASGFVFTVMLAYVGNKILKY